MKALFILQVTFEAPWNFKSSCQRSQLSARDLFHLQSFACASLPHSRLPLSLKAKLSFCNQAYFSSDYLHITMYAKMIMGPNHLYWAKWTALWWFRLQICYFLPYGVCFQKVSFHITLTLYNSLGKEVWNFTSNFADLAWDFHCYKLGNFVLCRKNPRHAVSYNYTIIYNRMPKPTNINTDRCTLERGNGSQQVISCILELSPVVVLFSLI